MKQSSDVEVREIPVDAIEEGPNSLRKFYDQAALHELSGSLNELGPLSPIIVQAKPRGEYELIIGSRRWRAAKKGGQRTILAFVKAGVDGRLGLLMVLTENLQRKDLTPFEEAWGLLKLSKEYGMSQYEIAKRLSCPEQFVRGRIQLLSLPEPVQKLVSEHQLNLATVDTLARLGSSEDQVRFARTVVAHGLSPDELNTLIRQELGRKVEARKRHGIRPLTAKRTCLKIDGFGEWVGSTVEEVQEMDQRGRAYVVASLRKLSNAITRAIGAVEKGH